MADRRTLLPVVSLYLSAVAMLALSTIIADAGDVPAIFIFGDSTADVGTNTFLSGSWARADFPHNGIDFPNSRPTGRFSNGLNTVDFLAKFMGFRRSPAPFLSHTQTTFLKQIIKRGANFASGGAGILDATGSTLIHQLKKVYKNLTLEMGQNATHLFLSRSMFLVSVGSNDILENFKLHGPQNVTQKKMFIANLIFKYEDHLTRLYKLGARKYGIVSVPPIGCCPSLRSKNASGGCIDDLDETALMFHVAVQTLLKSRLTSKLQGINYALGNAIEMVVNVFQHPLKFGMKNLTSACCGEGRFNGDVGCFRSSVLCSNRSEYLFWDRYHPTQAASKLAARSLYYGPPRFVSPINFKTLAELD